MFQVLVEFGDSRKVIALTAPEEENSYWSIIKETFEIDGEINLQIYSKDWDEYIDLEPGDRIEDRSKLRVIAKVSAISYMVFE